MSSHVILTSEILFRLTLFQQFRLGRFHVSLGVVSQTRRFLNATNSPLTRSCTEVLSTSIRSPAPNAICLPSMLATTSLPCISSSRVYHVPASSFRGTLSRTSILSPPPMLLDKLSSVLEIEVAMMRPN